jgi:hypothetical protein
LYRHWGSVLAVWPIVGVEVELYPFMNMALEGGERSASRPGRFLPPGKTRYPLYRRLGEPQGWSGQVRKILPPPGFDLRTIQPVASHYTDYVTLPKSETKKHLNMCKIIHIQTDNAISSSWYNTAENWVTTLKLEWTKQLQEDSGLRFILSHICWHI